MNRSRILDFDEEEDTSPKLGFDFNILLQDGMGWDVQMGGGLGWLRSRVLVWQCVVLNDHRARHCCSVSSDRPPLSVCFTAAICFPLSRARSWESEQRLDFGERKSEEGRDRGERET